jgi:hypothetical protein
MNNRELTLANVEWTTNYTADGSSFTAHATYTRDGVRRITTGYLATAEFEGLVNRYDWGMTRFVLTFQAVGQMGNINLVDMGVIGVFGEVEAGNSSEESKGGDEGWAYGVSDVQGNGYVPAYGDLQNGASTNGSQANGGLQSEEHTSQDSGTVENGTNQDNGASGNILLPIILLICLGFVGFLLYSNFLGKNVTIYQVYTDDSCKFLTRTKLSRKDDFLDFNNLPEKVQDKISENHFKIVLSKCLVMRHTGETFDVKFGDKAIAVYIPPGFNMKTHQIHINFDEIDSEAEGDDFYEESD